MVEVKQIILALFWIIELQSMMLNLVFIIDNLWISDNGILVLIFWFDSAKNPHVTFQAQNLLLLQFSNLVIL